LYLNEHKKLEHLKFHAMNYCKIGQSFYGVGIIAYGMQQLIIGDFRPAIVPEWPLWFHEGPALAYFTGVILILVGLAICRVFKNSEKYLRNVCLYLGTCFLILVLCCHIPNRLFISPYSPIHLGSWTDALKELAFAGGAFVMAGSFNTRLAGDLRNIFRAFLDGLMSVGKIFFSVMLVSFALDHFYYTPTVASLVPPWFGFPVFWTYFSAFALISAGVAIIARVYIRQVSFLLAIMLMTWFISLHIPLAIVDPFTANGNNIMSALDALVFSGIALVISTSRRGKVYLLKTYSV
jgi:hypothetical protein